MTTATAPQWVTVLAALSLAGNTGFNTLRQVLQDPSWRVSCAWAAGVCGAGLVIFGILTALWAWERRGSIVVRGPHRAAFREAFMKAYPFNTVPHRDSDEYRFARVERRFVYDLAHSVRRDLTHNLRRDRATADAEEDRTVSFEWK
jgi:hypothetical protein